MKLSVFNKTVLLLMLCCYVLTGQHKPCLVADSLVMKQSYMAAIEQYKLCYPTDTLDKVTLSSIANCYYLLGDFLKAKEIYHTLELSEDFVSEAYTRLAFIYETQQNLPKALKYNIALSKLYPGNPVYFRKMGNLYHLGNERMQAIESFQSALKINKHDLLAIHGLSEMYISLDSLQQADSLLNIGLTADSTHIGLSLLKSRVKYRMRQYSEVAQILYALTFQTELNNYYNKLLGYAFLQIDSLDKSIFHLQKSLLNEGDPEYALFYLALAFEKKMEHDKAVYFYNEAIKAGISENLDQYYRGLARVYSQKGSYNLVMESYKESLKYSKDNTIYFYMANTADQHLKDKTKALSYYKRYLNSNPNDKELIKIAKSRIKELKELTFMAGSKMDKKK